MRQRSHAGDVEGETIQGENGAFICLKGGREEVREVSFVYMSNFVQKVADLLPHNQR